MWWSGVFLYVVVSVLDRAEKIFAEGTDVLSAVVILAQQSLSGIDDAHHIAVGGVDDGAAHAGLHSQGHERRVQHLTHGQTEGDVAQTGSDMHIGENLLDGSYLWLHTKYHKRFLLRAAA